MNKMVASVFIVSLLQSVPCARAATAGSASIGAPDGTTYQVLSSRTIVRPDLARCGTYGESPAAVPAEFSQELREYTTYTKGKLVNRWRATEEVFVRCREP